MSERLYRLVESGRTNITAATLTRLAEAFAVDVAALLAPTRSVAGESRVRPLDPPVPSIAPAVVASLLLDPATLRDPAIAAALDVLLRRRGQLPRVANPSPRVAIAGPPRSGDPATDDVGPAAHFALREVVLPEVPKGSGLRTFLIALLLANPSGLLTSEMAEAAASAKLRHRKNEVHEVVRSLQESGDLVRAGRRGSFVYSLRRTLPATL